MKVQRAKKINKYILNTIKYKLLNSNYIKYIQYDNILANFLFFIPFKDVVTYKKQLKTMINKSQITPKFCIFGDLIEFSFYNNLLIFFYSNYNYLNKYNLNFKKKIFNIDMNSNKIKKITYILNNYNNNYNDNICYDYKTLSLYITKTNILNLNKTNVNNIYSYLMKIYNWKFIN